jgi:Protein of unknown function (DUF3304)
MSFNFLCHRVRMSFCGLMAALPIALLTGCFEEEKTGVSYIGVNHTDVSVIEVSPNGGKGGIMTAYAHGTSGDICCVTVPSKWRPGLTANISWQDTSLVKKDANGNEMLDDGVPILIASPRKTKTVIFPKYESPEILWIHFFPNDEVKLVMSKYGPGHPKHGLPSPYIPGVSK